MLRLSHSFRLDPVPSFQQAERLYQAGRKAEALDICEAALARTPNHFDALHLSGVICLDNGDNAQALAWLQKAAQLNPANARLQYHLGNAEMARWIGLRPPSSATGTRWLSIRGWWLR